ncbi:MAG: UDP-N-acetylglucosamine 1-carboxyvinyltransferase [Candidatus Muiribacteriota bacterium]
MQRYIINGGNKLNGNIKISGAKNSALPLIAATLLIKGQTVLKNIPDLVDVKTMFDLLRNIGAVVEYDKNSQKAFILTDKVDRHKVSYELVKKMRASFIIAGPLLSIFKRASVSLPGGCAIGTRPVDIHLKSFEKLGVRYKNYRGYINFLYSENRKSNSEIEILMDFPSVGATQNIIMATVIGDNRVRLINAAKEPEIETLIKFLNKAGANIVFNKNGEIIVNGVNDLKNEIEFENIPDRLEAGTFITAALITGEGSRLCLENVNINHMRNIIDKFLEADAQIEIKDKSLTVTGKNYYKPIKLSTRPHPGFPTDMQSQFCSFLSLVEGTSIVEENIFENRFMHISELVRMGANIHIEKNIAFINGVNKLYGSNIMASDIRAGAGLVLAALGAQGKSVVSRIYHIDRGHECFEQKLRDVGADIIRD